MFRISHNAKNISLFATSWYEIGVHFLSKVKEFFLNVCKIC